MKNIPKGAKVFQLKPLSKEPANTNGHHGGESQEFFVPTNDNVAMVLGNEAESQYVVLDIDNPSDPTAVALMAEAVKAPTRVVETPHGFQYIWTSPKALPRLRANLGGSTGVLGQLLSHGYVVGSGASVQCTGSKHVDGISCGVKHYTVQNAVEPQPAPPWVVALASELASRKTVVGQNDKERSGVPPGGHDKFGADLAYNLRKWGGLDETAIATFFREGGLKGVTACLEGYNEASPFTLDDSDRWARSAARATGSSVSTLPEGMPTETVLEEEETESFENASFIEAPLRWWIRGFVPRGHIVAMYGKGGRGKSSFGSWLLHEITNRDCAAAIFCVEESPKLFAARAIIGGAKRQFIHSVKAAGNWVFPKDIHRLESLIKRLNLKFVWFDSLYSHFEHVEGKTQSTQARIILGQMEVLCRELDCTILGVFHENKGGSYLGPTEMENVVRVLLHASRAIKSSKAPLKVKVEKTNMPFKPDTYLRFTAEKIELHDPETGETQLEEIEPGRTVPLMVPITQRITDGINEDEEMENVLDAAEAVGATKEWKGAR